MWMVEQVFYGSSKVILVKAIDARIKAGIQGEVSKSREKLQ
jgi:hypothetical protein